MTNQTATSSASILAPKSQHAHSDVRAMPSLALPSGRPEVELKQSVYHLSLNIRTNLTSELHEE